MRFHPPSALALTLWIAAPLGAQEDIVDTYADGSTRARYSIDAKGRRHGAYLRYHRNGQVRIRATYRNGKRTGVYQEYDRRGKRRRQSHFKDDRRHGEHREFSADGKRVLTAHYRNGRKHGAFSIVEGKTALTRQQWNAGELSLLEGIAPFPRSAATLRAALARIQKAPQKIIGADTDPALPRRLRALRRLQAYRYLCRLRYADMSLRPEWNVLCDYGARLCQHIGRLDHTPSKPAGMDEESYRKGYRATSHSNLSAGSGMVRSVDAYMNDSDAKNIARVGHRRWCLNPTMKFTAFGEAGRYSAMWSFDKSGAASKDLDAVLYPPAGFVPVGYFGARHAWSVQFLRGGRPKPAEVKITVHALDAQYVRKGPALRLDHQGATGNCLIFRPVGLQVRPGARYWCEILLPGDTAPSLRYLVEFIADAPPAK